MRRGTLERGITHEPLTESHLEQALAVAPAVIYIGTLEDWRFRPTWVSANIETILGFTREEALAEGWWLEHVHPDDVGLDWVREARSRPEGRWDGQYRFFRSDGREIWIHEQVKWEPGPDLHTTRVVGSWMDVTTSHRREMALADSEERFRQLVTHIPQVFWINAVEGGLLYVSPSYEQVWGRPAAELYERRSSWRESIHPDDRERVFCYLSSRRGAEYEVTYRIVRPNGEIRWIRDRGFPVPDSTGRIYRMAGIAEDITERVLATQRVEAAERHYRRLITTSPYAVYTMDVNGVFTELNPAAEELLGAPASVLLGRSFMEIIAPESRDVAADAFQQMLTGETDDVSVKIVVLTPAGERRVLSVAATTMRDRGVVEGIHGIARDITQEVEQDQRIRMLAEALDRLPDAVCIERDDGSILYSNEAFQELTAGRGNEQTGLQALLADDTSPRERRAVRDELIADGAWRGRTSIPRGDTMVPLEIVARRIELGRHTVTILLARDVTEQVERELQLRRTERLASLGTLVGGVAHELNNPLTAIAGFVELMLAEERSEEDRDALETLRRETQRVAKIVSDLRLLARESQDVKNRKLQAIDVNDIIRHAVRVRRYALETSNIRVNLKLEPDLPKARGVPSEIEQVVLNLIVNASHALDASDRQDKVLTIRSAATRAGVAFEVIDNGSGIPEKVIEHIFDPFFTTKSPGEGTGLGLSLVHSIISEHGGRISVNSIEGRGSAFSVLLPFSRDELDEDAAASQPAANTPTVQPLRVLIVDDEAAIRLALVRHLRRRGHTVETAEDGAAALEQIASSGFDVILSDIRMPGMSGDRLLRELRERGSEDAIRRLLFMTGDPASEAVQQGVEHAIPVLSKPFTLREITEKIEEHAASSGS